MVQKGLFFLFHTVRRKFDSEYRITLQLTIDPQFQSKAKTQAILQNYKKNPPTNAGDQERKVQSQVKKIPWSRKWQPTPVFFPGKFYGQRSWAGYSSQGCKESDTLSELSTHTLWQTPSGSLGPGADSVICPLEVCFPFIIFVLPHCMFALGLSLTL